MMQVFQLRLGIIGMSPGNGHPYSWSSICNGYNWKYMKDCPFPVIPDYLARQSFPEDAIADAKVTHIWTQDIKTSEHVAKSANIPHVIKKPEDMIGKVDAVLLARDDAENHMHFSRVFLKSGLPIYIDKPIALTTSALQALYDRQQYEGQIFSCSAMRFAPELLEKHALERQTGTIRHIAGYTPKSWAKYAIHVIEPVLSMMNLYESKFHITSCSSLHVSSCILSWNSGLTTAFTAMGDVKANIMLQIFGESGSCEIVFRDSFSAFKRALQEFIFGLRERRTMIPYCQHEKAVSILEKGMRHV